MPEVDESPSTIDRALLRAIRAWSGQDFEFATRKFSANWRERLRSSWSQVRSTLSEEAWTQIRRDHQASARHDPSRVHSSWFVRALKSEARSVQLAVTAHAPTPLRQTLSRGLKIDPRDLETDQLPDPEALAWALALWTERLVGDVPEREDDPPVVVAMTRLRPSDLTRLVKVCGVVKHAFALFGTRPQEINEMLVRFTPLDRVRLGFFRRNIGVPDPRLVPQAQLDLRAIAGDRRRGHGRVGLVTFGRLLEAVEPHRARWTTQHVPYSIARAMRQQEMPGLPRKAIQTWESWVLEAAWARLFAEGRLVGDRAGTRGLEPGERL